MATSNDALFAIDAEWKTGDRARAREMAKEFVAENRDVLAPRFGGMDIPALVAMVSHYRGVGDEANRILVDTWLLSEHQPQVIGGVFNLGGIQNFGGR